MRVYGVVIAPEREEHIARHRVSVEEVDEVVLGNHLVFRTRQKRLRLIGQTDPRRYLTVILAQREHGIYGLVIARDADEAERRLYQRRRRP